MVKKYDFPNDDGFEKKRSLSTCLYFAARYRLRLAFVSDILLSNNRRGRGVTDFVREHTLASGGPYCDCGYKRKDRGGIHG